MNDNPFEIKEEACASSPDPVSYTHLEQEGPPPAAPLSFLARYASEHSTLVAIMKFQIKHECRGRIRVQAVQQRRCV